MSDYISDIYNHKEMTREELFEYFQKTTELPHIMFRGEEEEAQDVLYELLLPFYKDEIQDYDSFLQGRTVIAFGFTNNEKRFLKRHVEKHGGTFRFTRNGKENLFIIYSGTSLYNMLYALRKAREEEAIIVQIDHFVKNLGERFNEGEEEERKQKEREEEAKRPKAGPIYIPCSDDYLAQIPKTPLSEISLEDDVFHVVGKVDCSYWDDQYYLHSFSSKDDIYDFIEKRGGQFIKKESGNVTCVVFGKEPAKEAIDRYLHSVKLIDIESFVEWLRHRRYNVCSIEDLANFPRVSANEISLEDDVFHIIGSINYNYWDKNGTEFHKFNTQSSVYSFINAKGGQYLKKDSKEVTCVIYGKEPAKDAMMSYLDTAKYIDAESFIEWLRKQIAINKKCREFGEKYVASVDTILRPYQQYSKREIFKKWNSFFNVMLQLPTGTGKTVLFTSIIRDLADVEDSKILILAHRKELIEQISEHLKIYDIDHGIITSGRKRCLEKMVQVASVQTLTHDNNIDLLDELKPKFIIIDEAHHSLAESYTKFWKKCVDCWKLGVTATPYRLNNKSFLSHFDALVQSMEIDDFINQGYLAKYDYMVDNPQSSLSQTIKSIKEKSSTGDYKTATLLRELNIPQHIQRLIVCYEQYVKGKKGLVYAINKDHAHNICDAYKLIGVEAVYIDSDTPKSQRSEIVEKFKSGDVQVMVNVDIFSEGFDCPDVEFIQLARPTWSLAKYLQQVGRGMRPCEGKDETVILDNSRMFVKFGLPSEKRLWQYHFDGDPLVKNDYKQEDEERERQLNLVCSFSNEMMVKIDLDTIKLAEELVLEERNKKESLRRAKEDSIRAAKIAEEEERRERARKEQEERFRKQEEERRLREEKLQETKNGDELERLQRENEELMAKIAILTKDNNRQKMPEGSGIVLSTNSHRQEDTNKQKEEQRQKRQSENERIKSKIQEERKRQQRENEAYRQREKELEKEFERSERQDTYWKVLGYIAAASVLLLVIWQTGLLIPLGLIGLASCGLLKK